MRAGRVKKIVVGNVRVDLSSKPHGDGSNTWFAVCERFWVKAVQELTVERCRTMKSAADSMANSVSYRVYTVRRNFDMDDKLFWPGDRYR